MNILITPVGRNARQQVYQGILKAKAIFEKEGKQLEQICFIYSSGSQADAQRVIDVYKDNEAEINIKRACIEIDSYSEIRNKIKALANETINDDVILDISGGSKLWTINLWEFFANKENTTIFYTDMTSGTSSPHNPKNRNMPMLALDPTIIFKLNNKEITLSNPIEFTEEQDSDVRKIFELYDFNRQDLLALTNDKDCIEDCTFRNSSLKVEGDTVTIKLCKSHGDLTKQLTSREAKALLADNHWFEYYIAKRIADCNLTQSPIYLNVSRKRSDNFGDDKEFDIVVSIETPTASKMLFVECKTGCNKPNMIRNFAKAVENYGGRSAIKLFCSYQRMPKPIKEVCKDNSILIYSVLDTFANKELFELIEKELHQKNK